MSSPPQIQEIRVQTADFDTTEAFFKAAEVWQHTSHSCHLCQANSLIYMLRYFVSLSLLWHHPHRLWPISFFSSFTAYLALMPNTIKPCQVAKLATRASLFQLQSIWHHWVGAAAAALWSSCSGFTPVLGVVGNKPKQEEYERYLPHKHMFNAVQGLTLNLINQDLFPILCQEVALETSTP